MARPHEGGSEIKVTSWHLIGDEFDFAVNDTASSTSAAQRDNVLYVTTNGDLPSDDGELDFAAADGSGEAAGTYILYQDVFIPAVQHDYDLS